MGFHVYIIMIYYILLIPFHDNASFGHLVIIITILPSVFFSVFRFFFLIFCVRVGVVLFGDSDWRLSIFETNLKFPMRQTASAGPPLRYITQCVGHVAQVEARRAITCNTLFSKFVSATYFRFILQFFPTCL